MTLLAILLPWLSFFLRGKIIQGILCLFLQITLIGWLPAAIWAVISLNNGRAEKRNKELINALKQQQK
jgi:TM2 domain-containing membrane protein YozV